MAYAGQCVSQAVLSHNSIGQGMCICARPRSPVCVKEHTCVCVRVCVRASLPQVRVPTHIVSTICDDRGEEPTYYGVSMSELIEGGMGRRGGRGLCVLIPAQIPG